MRAAAVAALLLGIGAVGLWLVRSGTALALAEAGAERLANAGGGIGLKVEKVEVEGRRRESPAAILKALGVKRGTPILSVDLAAARTRLEALPWVRSAALERRLPDTLYLRLAERQPLAFWQNHGKLSLIDRDGKVVTDDNLTAFGNLIVLVGEDAPQRGAALIDMLASEPGLSQRVAAAVRVGGRRWNLRLDNGIEVALPEIDPERAWHRLATLEREKQLLQRNILAVDLRLPDRLVVRVPPEPKPAKKGRPSGKAT